MNDSMLAGIGGTILILYLLFVFGMIALVGVIWWRITAKTGNSGCLGLLIFIPIANLILLLILAFSRWPIERELDDLKARFGGNAPTPPTTPTPTTPEPQKEEKTEDRFKRELSK